MTIDLAERQRARSLDIPEPHETDAELDVMEAAEEIQAARDLLVKAVERYVDAVEIGPSPEPSPAQREHEARARRFREAILE